MVPTRMLPLMAMESVTWPLTDRARVSANKLRVISQAHRVDPSDAVKSSFELRKSLTIRPAHMLAGVLECVAESSRKTPPLIFNRPGVSSIRLRSLDIDSPSTVFILSNAYPCFEKLIVGNVGPDVNAVSVKVRVVLVLVRVPTAELVTPEKEELLTRNSTLRHHPLETQPHILVEFSDLFRKRHPAQVHRREIQRCNNIGAAKSGSHHKPLNNRPQSHIFAEEFRKDGRATVTAVAVSTIEGSEKLMIRMLRAIQPPTCHPAIGQAVGFSQQPGSTALFLRSHQSQKFPSASARLRAISQAHRNSGPFWCSA